MSRAVFPSKAYRSNYSVLGGAWCSCGFFLVPLSEPAIGDLTVCPRRPCALVLRLEAQGVFHQIGPLYPTLALDKKAIDELYRARDYARRRSPRGPWVPMARDAEKGGPIE